MLAIAVVLLLGGAPKSLGEKALEADLILEYEVTFPANPKQPPQVVRVLHGTPEPDQPPPKLSFVSGATDKCLAAAKKKGRVRALAFFKGGRQIYGIEQRLPTLTDLDPDYPKIVSAVQQAVRWRKGLREDPEPGNPYAQELADARQDPVIRHEFKGQVDRECD